LISSTLPAYTPTTTAELPTVAVFWVLGDTETDGPCPGCQQAECECILRLPCPHPPVAAHTLADLRQLLASRSQTKLTFTITIDEFCSAIWYADVDVRQLVTDNGNQESWNHWKLEVPHIPGAVLAVAATDSLNEQYFKVSCRSTDQQSNWNFTATSANGHRFMSAAGSGRFFDRFLPCTPCWLWLRGCHRLSAWLLSPRRQSAPQVPRQVHTDEVVGPSRLDGARWVHTDFDDSGWTTRVVAGSGGQGVWAELSGSCCGVPAHSYFRIGPFELPTPAPLELGTIAVPIAAV
jgi:hypothetical protein